MRPASSWTQHNLLSLKSNELKFLALSLGASSSGTKDVVSSRVWNVMHSRHADGTDERKSRVNAARRKTVLSIDMGIKNFAYCTLSLSDSHDEGRRPKLHDWKCLDLLDFRPVQNSTDRFAGVIQDLFRPAILADYAIRLVKQLVLSPDSSGALPDVVLIERQRYRTMGSAAVQEWTIRVNMLEAMLWAILRSEKDHGRWEGEIHGVSPSLVANWWQAQDDLIARANNETGAILKEKKLSTKQRKNIRIQRAAKCLSTTVEIASQEAQAAYDMYIRRTGPRSSHSQYDALSKARMPQKLDDLADCFLQAFAWFAWERNQWALASSELRMEQIYTQMSSPYTAFNATIAFKDSNR